MKVKDKPLFQPAPANYDGRIPGIIAMLYRCFCVSIRARQLRRANPLGVQIARLRSNVSIRARQLRRANPSITSAGLTIRFSFNPRPPITTGESIMATRASLLPAAFQSAPANYDGRILPSSADVVGYATFQSAPANYDGRIHDHSAQGDQDATFQSAPANYDGRILAVLMIWP